MRNQKKILTPKTEVGKTKLKCKLVLFDFENGQNVKWFSLSSALRMDKM